MRYTERFRDGSLGMAVVHLAAPTDNLAMSTKLLEYMAILIDQHLGRGSIPGQLDNGAARMPETSRPNGVTIDEGIESIRDALAAVAYGSLVLTVHEGRVVQIDVTQRKRFKVG